MQSDPDELRYAEASDTQDDQAPGPRDAARTEHSGAERGMRSVDAEPAPMTFSLLGRFFAVPLLIIATMVGGAILVVLLFGGPAAPDERPIGELLQTLEAGSGEKSLGVLLPREKELWQAALELSVRLEKKEQDKELTPQRLQETADRLSAMVLSDIQHLDAVVSFDPKDREAHQAVRSKRLEFLIRALGRTEQPLAVPTLVDVVRRGDEPHARVAMEMLGHLHEMPQSVHAVAPVADRLASARLPETRLVACTVLSVLADPDDAEVLERLNAVRLASDGEVAWSAALALARLGSPLGKSTLLDLLDRPFLESGRLYQTIDEQGVPHRYRLPPQRVDAILMAAVDAAAQLDDPQLWQRIERLQDDPSPVVRAAADKAVRNRADFRGSREPDGDGVRAGSGSRE